MFYQPFDGANGAAVNWTSTNALGSPISEYQTGASTATFTTTDPIRGTASARYTKPAGSSVSQCSYYLAGGTRRVRAHVYLRVPAAIPAGGVRILSVRSSRALHLLLAGDGSAWLSASGTNVGATAPAGTLPAAGTIIRASIGVDADGETTAALYAGHSTTPVWTVTGPAGATGDLTEVQTGVPWTSDASAAYEVIIDDFRAETDVAAPLLPPEVIPSRTWVREPVGWRRLGEADAVEERYVPPAGRGALPPGQQTYPVPTGAVHVSPSGSDSTGNGTSAAPYATITRALTAVPANGTIVLRTGNHALGYRPASAAAYDVTNAWAGILVDKPGLTIQGYPGEAAWIDGSAVHTGWTAAGSVWEKAITLTHDRSPTGSYGADDSTTPNWQYVNPARPYAAWPERVWVDGVELRQVANRAAVGPGTFCVEGATGGTGGKLFTSSKYVIGTNPSGREVRVAEYATCLSSTGAGFTLRGVGVRRYASSVPQRGAVKLRHADCRLENVTIEDTSALAVTLYRAHTAVVTDCTIRRAGMLGLEGNQSDDITFRRLHITGTNRQGFNTSPESAGIKITQLRRPVISHVTVHDCACTGIWLDESVSQALVHTCDVHWVDHHGIHVELGGAATVANCVVTAPGVNCMQIFNASGAQRVWNNTLARPGRLTEYGRCLAIVADNRAPLKAGAVGLDPRFGFPHPDGVDALTVDVTVNNNILGPSAAQGLLWNEDNNRNSGTARNWTEFGIKTNSNLYVVRRSKPDWKWVLSAAGSANPTVLWNQTDLTSRGLDTASKVLPGVDYATDLNGAPTPVALAARPTGQPIPADIATATGLTAGATNTIGAVRVEPNAPPQSSATITPAQVASTTYVGNSGRGQYIFYHWDHPNPVPANLVGAVDGYHRRLWREIEPARGQYNWAPLDADLQVAANRGGRFGTRFMPVEGGTANALPDDVAALPTTRNVTINGVACRVPDWNDPAYISRWREFMGAVAARYDNDPRLWSIDVGGYGHWGEGHNFPYENAYPAPGGQTEGTLSTLQQIIKAATDQFQNTWIYYNTHTVKTGGEIDVNATADLMLWAMQQSPRLNMRTDALGGGTIQSSTTQFYAAANSRGTATGVPAVDTPAGRWRIAPMSSEYPWGTADWGLRPGSTDATFAEAQQQVRDWHIGLIGNSNWFDDENGLASYPQADRDAYADTSRVSGYRHAIPTVQVTAGSTTADLALTWRQDGTAPTYDQHTVTYRCTPTTGTARTATGTRDLRTLTSGTHVDTATVTGLTSGTSYTLAVRVANVTAPQVAPMRLASGTSDSEGWHTLGVFTTA